MTPSRSGPAAIAVLVDTFPELSQTFVVSEAQALRALGRAVVVEARGRARRPNPDVPDGLPARFRDDESRAGRLAALAWLLVRHPAGVARDLAGRRRWPDRGELTPLRRLAPLAWRLRRRGAGHVHVHFATGVAADGVRVARVLGLTCSVTAHAYEIFQRPRNLRHKLEAADFATSGCDYTVEHLRGLVGPERRGRVHKVIMGVDPARFRRTRPYPGGRTVVAVGRLVEKKGFDDLLEAAARLQAGARLDRLLIAGDGPLREALERRKRRLGLEQRVELLGPRSPREVRDLLEQADVLAMPCVVAADGDRDSMPVVVKEALAMEVPVVATREVGLPEVVRDGWGRLVPPRDPEALAAALRELLELPAAERAAMGRAGRRFVERTCSVEAEAAKLLALIDAASGS